MNSPDYTLMRRAMIDSQLRTSGVSAPWIIAAMGEVPREDFVDADRATTAYMDRAIPLGAGRSLNPPVTTGLMLQAAGVRAEDKVLIIGAGTGYLSALVAKRADLVAAVEQSTDLIGKARINLKAAVNVNLVEASLNQGAAKYGPYSLILIDGAIARLNDEIIAQLTDGGRAVAGLNEGAVSRLAMGIKRGGQIVLRPVGDCEISTLPGFEHIKEFVF